MKTKLFTLWIALTVSVGTLFAEKVKIGNLYYELNAKYYTAKVTYQELGSPHNYSGLTSVNIPTTVTYSSTTYSVASIGDNAFYGCSSLTSMTIPSSITSIGDKAFYGCSSLTSVTIPSSVTSIGEWAFYGCSSLTSVTIPNSITNIAYGTFYGCSALTSIIIPNSVKSIEAESFCGCASMTSVTIGNGVKSIGDLAFRRCNNITTVTIGNGVTSIGYEAFAYCSSLISVTIPISTTSIGTGAFRECSSMTSVKMGKNVTSIEENAFSGCYGLTAITCEAVNPPTLGSSVFNDVDKSIPLYVPAASTRTYKSADQWKDFTNITGIGGSSIETKEEDVNIYYLDKNEGELHSEFVTFHMPVAPVIAGFTFVKWIATSDNIKEGIMIKAVYTSDTLNSAPSVYTNPSNPAQKLIRNGNVYVLHGDKTYTLTGQEVK